MERHGRRRLFRLADRQVAHALEALAVIARPAAIVSLSQNIAARELRAGRSCYDHLAGRLGVSITDALVERGAIHHDGDDDFELTLRGDRFLTEIGVDVGLARTKHRRFARICIDWSERRPHLAGALGAAVRDRFLRSGWIELDATSRVLRITPQGRTALTDVFSVNPERLFET